MDKETEAILHDYIQKKTSFAALNKVAIQRKNDKDWKQIYQYILGFEDFQYDEAALLNRIRGYYEREKRKK